VAAGRVGNGLLRLLLLRQVSALFPSIWFMALGAFFVFFRTWIGKQAVEWNYRLLGRRFNQRHYEVSFTALGIVFVAIGVLALVGVIHFKP
jgi:hypothetical protein